MQRIALIGPESTGKTTLVRQLAEHFQSALAEEYARRYVEQLGRKYTLADIEACTRQQLKSEEEAAINNPRFLFCDTELIVAKVWCLDVFHCCPSWILEAIESHRYDLFLLTMPDLPFRHDPVRENPHRRQFFFDWYKKELEQYGFPFTIISGTGSARLDNAIHAIGKKR